MVAFMCQRYPNKNPFEILTKFFDFFGMWDFSKPIMLAPFEGLNPKLTGGRVLQSWNPLVHPRDKYQVAAIITPSNPFMNSG